MLIVSRCLFISACKPLGTQGPWADLWSPYKKEAMLAVGTVERRAFWVREPSNPVILGWPCPCTSDHVSSVSFIHEASSKQCFWNDTLGRHRGTRTGTLHFPLDVSVSVHLTPLSLLSVYKFKTNWNQK